MFEFPVLLFFCAGFCDEFQSTCEPFPQVGASLPRALPFSPSLSFSLTFGILGFCLKLVQSVVWDGFASTLRRRLVGWVHLYISYQSVLASLLPGIIPTFSSPASCPFQGSAGIMAFWECPVPPGPFSQSNPWVCIPHPEVILGKNVLPRVAWELVGSSSGFPGSGAHRDGARCAAARICSRGYQML